MILNRSFGLSMRYLTQRPRSSSTDLSIRYIFSAELNNLLMTLQFCYILFYIWDGGLPCIFFLLLFLKALFIYLFIYCNYLPNMASKNLLIKVKQWPLKEGIVSEAEL